MLVYFTVGNYKSIKDKQTINLLGSSLSEHRNSNLIENDFGAMLKTSLLYGHNASGKSKLLNALVFYRWMVINSATELQSSDQISVESFLLNSDTEDKDSFFESSFIIGKRKFRYGFECSEKRVNKEWLLETTKLKEYPVFLRLGDEFEIDKKRFPNSEGLEKRTRNNALFLSVCAQWNVKKADEIIKWFATIYTVHGLMTENYRDTTLELIQDAKTTYLVDRIISKVDLGVEGVGVYDIELPKEQTSNVPEDVKEALEIRKPEKKDTTAAVITFHKKFQDKKEIGSVPLLLDVHGSDGTKKFFNVLGLIVKALFEDRLIIIDELDARFHALLTKTILKLFNSSKIRTSAQIIAACHDVTQIDKRILRRDQILMVDKDKYGATVVKPLSVYKPRKQEAIDKNYLTGRYGGIPMISDIEDLFSNGKEEN